MKDIEKYTNPETSQEEMEELTGKLLRAKFNRDKKERWAEILEKEHNVRRSQSGMKVISRNRSRWWLLVAASLLLPVALYLTLWKQPEASALQLAEAYLSEEKILEPQTRKGAEEVAVWSQKATEAYNSGKYREAIEWWRKMEAEVLTGMRPDDYFFRGASYLRLNDNEAAIKDFEHLRGMGTQTSKFQAEATWLLALAQLRAGHNEAATRELQQVVQDGWRTEKAQKLLKALSTNRK